jgi:hypothetical protein
MTTRIPKEDPSNTQRKERDDGYIIIRLWMAFSLYCYC